MCLVIDVCLHPTLKPLVAKYDIPVIKVLVTDECNNYSTPFMNYPVVFSKGVAILEACLDNSKIVDINGCRNFIIEKGIHSFTKNYHPFLTRTNKKAIIPKGTRYYFGDENDMVSEKLIIFE